MSGGKAIPMDEAIAAKLGIANEDGWIGAFTRQQAEGAIPNGTTIVKVNSAEGDRRSDGALGVVLGSIDGSLIDPDVVKHVGARVMYFVEWRGFPRHAVSIVETRIRPAP